MFDGHPNSTNEQGLHQQRTRLMKTSRVVGVVKLTDHKRRGVVTALRRRGVVVASRRRCVNLTDHKVRVAAASNRLLKMGLVAGTDCLIGDASQRRGTRVCGPLQAGYHFSFTIWMMIQSFAQQGVGRNEKMTLHRGSWTVHSVHNLCTSLCTRSVSVGNCK
jgi:hypothetical protein